jgi:hypothetical protein
MAPKPQTADRYSREEAEQVKAACLTIAAILGDLMDDLCVVGGLVPSMICDAPIDPAAADESAHCGTTDLDVGLSLALLDDERYREIAQRLREREFRPDEKENGRKTRQRWRWRDLKVTVDFLIPPTEALEPEARLQHLEEDLAALVVKPLHLAFDERLAKDLDGRNLLGDSVKRAVQFAGPAAFLAMKAYAYHLRGERKDAYDLVFVLRNWNAGIPDVAERLADRATTREEIVTEALEYLQNDFGRPDSAGPRDVSRFLGGVVDEARVADAYGAVADFLAAYDAVASKTKSPVS